MHLWTAHLRYFVSLVHSDVVATALPPSPEMLLYRLYGQGWPFHGDQYPPDIHLPLSMHEEP